VYLHQTGAIAIGNWSESFRLEIKDLFIGFTVGFRRTCQA
jgi:hypothetical protein